MSEDGMQVRKCDRKSSVAPAAVILSLLQRLTHCCPVLLCGHVFVCLCVCTGKTRRLKQAKEEAHAEIEQHRMQREKEFKTREAAALGSHGNSAVEVDKETGDKMGHIQDSYQQNRGAVLGNLLKMVCDIKPEIHANYRTAG
ncbi:V-type proton ATPase subunit G 1-like [Anguilla anguilla]|uniref:V-type proton ATPase subunit G 1-like n=1 Tax=Anguilla anguilla TaxID=7936 RepID=UPI0015B1DD31|nr:V-type proton ATPase subunit G 1-like [Anguilla anguilla]